MYTTQCLPFLGRKITFPISDSKGASLKWIPTSVKNKGERICCIFTFYVAFFQIVFLYKVIERHQLLPLNQV